MTTQPDEMITYANRKELIADLKRRGDSRFWIWSQLRHEDAHMKKAIELGYNPKYCLGLTRSQGITTHYRPGIALSEPFTDEDLIQILNAPRKLSRFDKEDLERLKNKHKTS